MVERLMPEGHVWKVMAIPVSQSHMDEWTVKPDEIQRLRAVADAIDALHRQGILYPNVCCECDYEWPCDTHMRLHGTEEADRG